MYHSVQRCNKSLSFSSSTSSVISTKSYSFSPSIARIHYDNNDTFNDTFKRSFSANSGKNVPKLLSQYYPLKRLDCNVGETIAQKVGRNLHQQQNHPIHRVHEKIVKYFNQHTSIDMKVFNDISPIVSVDQNFDSLNIPSDHVSRSMSDTYYLTNDTVLRCHTSAHQVDLLKQGYNSFLVTGDVYRRDEIDKTHYPVFHQTEGIHIPSTIGQHHKPQSKEEIESDLKKNLEGLAKYLFGNSENTNNNNASTTQQPQQFQMRWIDAYFPFTDPSYELEIFYNDEWLEVLGCGVIHPKILDHAGRQNCNGWAFGLGLERLAMVLYQIPDIRLFWTDDDRFHRQFQTKNITNVENEKIIFQPYSKYPLCYKDISFWLPPSTNSNQNAGVTVPIKTKNFKTETIGKQNDDTMASSSFHVNDLNELVRDIGGDLIEQVQLIDAFQHPVSLRTSHCYRITYRSMDRSLTNEEIDKIQAKIREIAVRDLNVELR